MASRPTASVAPSSLSTRTISSDSTTSPLMSSGSPTSPQSPTERSFFSAISQKVSQARTRSRSRNRVTRDRSRSPLPPTKMDTSSSATAQAGPSSPRLEQSKHYPQTLQSPTTNDSERKNLKRYSSDSSEFHHYGRHANQWLFNDFSIRETAKGFFEKRGRSSREEERD
ncbi:hypothetical protein M501DRAFT_1061617 [Patellaria atrata CBS 101060]|uniref:Uncharacterized protein n=1 Tax=Patellaria atrata CBS 101060 TaxID=1346257 RepID=A0A9P4S1B4_9PEZI|nr:hypothetical protein M501DRAFT_1061617 [Patellaria atrata CBS 101060]